MGRILVGSVVILSLLCASHVFGDSSKDGYLISYRGSVSLPEEVAFRTWLSLMKGVRDHPEIAESLVAEALDIDLDSRSGHTEAASFVTAFQEMHRELRIDRAASIAPTLCSSELKDKRFDEIVDTLNTLEMVKRNVTTDYLSIAYEMLSPEQETAFKAHLNEMKKSITHSEIDSGAVYDKQPGRDIRSDLDQLCSRVQTRAQR